ncbi:MAG: M23 family metallopeptidase [Candidatus Eisenbacteria bacterium]
MAFRQSTRTNDSALAGSEAFHITISSPTEARSWQFRVSRRQALGGLVVSAVILVVAMAGLFSTGFLLTRIARIQALNAENIQLRRQLSRVSELENRLEALDAARLSLLSLLGLSDAEDAAGDALQSEMPTVGEEPYARVEPISSVGEAALREIRHDLRITPLSGPLTRSFGKLGQGGIFHTGLDIAGETGAPVVSAGEGVVSSAGWDETFGWVLVIAHSVRLKTVYGHNSEILVKIGDSVAAGQVVAEVGSTGLSSAAHLHFEVHWAGKAIDPVLVFPSLERQVPGGGLTS